jgi:exopolysaccharide production protein ExoZ
VSKLFKRNVQAVILTLIFFLLVTFGINPIIFEFLLGIYCAILSDKLKISAAVAKIVLVLGCSSLSLSFLIDFSVSYRTIAFGIPGFFLTLGMAKLNPITNQTAIALGDSSYSTYLVQIFTIPIYFKLVPPMNIPGDLIGLCTVLFTVISGHFLFWKIEKYLEHQIYRRVKLKKY